MSWQFGASTDFLFVEFLGHLTFCSSRLCFLRSGFFRDVRRLDFCIFVVHFFPMICVPPIGGWGRGTFPSLIYELSRQEGEVLCVFFFVFARLSASCAGFFVALRNALREKFSGANFGLQALVSGHCFFVLFCLGFS